ncbi:hypothetical protein IOK_18006 [Yersinia enterocolitica subsp. palearctica PhRBD_Ye1]|nr:hypothetical protein IOK_18006 [Yersinia enterocolitica subsp. palearctica PhRBD_Ye1]
MAGSGVGSLPAWGLTAAHPLGQTCHTGEFADNSYRQERVAIASR